MINVVIIGAGPAGLTAAYEILSKNNKEYTVTVLEENSMIGGISKTVNYKGNRMDMGGHRFFSKSKEVNLWWNHFLPMQGSKSFDDITLNRDAHLVEGGPDPEKTDKVMLFRHRVSRILFSGKFYDYPISLKKETFQNMGFLTTILCGFSYLKAAFFKKEDSNLENFYINRFGKKLYEMFFEYYTYNLWGRHPRDIDASWGSQRVKGLSIIEIIKNMISKTFSNKPKSNLASMEDTLNSSKVETSLIEEFKYPKLGPGELWETVASEIEKLGGNIIMNAKAIKITKKNNAIVSITYKSTKMNSNSDSITKETLLQCDYVYSSMPIKDLIENMNDVPSNILNIAKGLPYRDYMAAGILTKKLKLENKTNIKTISNIVPDNWIYVQDRKVKLGRIQIFNNWSPYMVKDISNTIWVGLEYFVNEGDEYWTMSDKDFANFAINEMIKINLIDTYDDIIDFHIERVKKAYPAYFDTYSQINDVISYLNNIENLYCIGRNGQHRYNNIDHSMITAFEAVKCMLSNNKDKSEIWNVNTEKEYHEKENG